VGKPTATVAATLTAQLKPPYEGSAGGEGAGPSVSHRQWHVHGSSSSPLAEALVTVGARWAS
jgi:hypothetical protein